MNQGFLNVLKPPGMTSHDVVSVMRRIFRIKRIGHTGTLDPAAAGVLPVGVGTATRLIEYLEKDDKAYRAEITFGFSTDTGDDTGEVLVREDYEMPTKEAVLAVLKSLEGDGEQLPPMYSAIKINGKKLYELARAGKEVERTPRPVTIHRIDLVEYRQGCIVIDVACSKGTYIRTLCMDIGDRLGIPAVMSFLLRTSAGAFTLRAAKTLEEIAEEKFDAMIPMDEVLDFMAVLQLSPQEGSAFENGQQIRVKELPEGGKVRVYCGPRFIGIARLSEDKQRWIPEKVFHEEI